MTQDELDDYPDLDITAPENCGSTTTYGTRDNVLGYSPEDKANNLLDVFEMFDMDHRGTLDLGELWGALNHVTGKQQDYQQVAATMAKFDSSGDGALNLEEFLALFYPPNKPPPKPVPDSDTSEHDDGKFVDSEFPPNTRSLGDCSALDESQVTWVRAPDLTPGNDELFMNIEPNDIAQGNLGDCWFLAGVSAIAEFPGAIENVFITKKISDEGLYRIKMWNGSAWEEFIIDDLIPCIGGKPAFVQPAGNELWAVLLEKALAKWCGTYAATEGGFENFCWEMLTGCNDQVGYAWQPNGQWQTLDVNFPNLKSPHDIQATVSPEGMVSPDDMWAKLNEYDGKNYIMGASTSKGEDSGKVGHSGGEAIRTDGIVKGHAYSLLAISEEEGFKMVQLRNPWGNDAEWKGRFSDHSNDWAENPDLKDALCFEAKPDGIFWMTWEDYQDVFDRIWICRKSMATPSRQVIQEKNYIKHGEARKMNKDQKDKYSRHDPEANGRKTYSMSEKVCGRGGACGPCSIM
jgi:calpain-15